MRGAALNVKKLRSGYTTGACAAAAAKAAMVMLLSGDREKAKEVEIPFPDGSRVAFAVVPRSLVGGVAFAFVIKDGGDDPDVTNGAEIVAEARWLLAAPEAGDSAVLIEAGEGVGCVTKPGLSVPVGAPAINPVPQRMIRAAVAEAFAESEYSGLPTNQGIAITISVTNGEKLAKKTLNARLGILGGISILGTTGIVRPLSAEAWTSTIAASMDVARAVGLTEIVLSTGRVSEKAHMKRYGFPEESYAMMGDYVEFSLRRAAEKGFARIHLCAQWAKMVKISLAVPQTHVRHGALDVRKSIAHLCELGIDVPTDREFNTVREVYDHIMIRLTDPVATLKKVCIEVKRHGEAITGKTPVTAHLVSYEGEIIIDSE